VTPLARPTPPPTAQRPQPLYEPAPGLHPARSGPGRCWRRRRRRRTPSPTGAPPAAWPSCARGWPALGTVLRSPTRAASPPPSNNSCRQPRKGTAPWSRPRGDAARPGRPPPTNDARRRGALAEILAHPEVARWWRSFDLDRVPRELIDPEDGAVPFAVEADGQLIGLIQSWEEPDPDYRHAPIDGLLHPRLAGLRAGRRRDPDPGPPHVRPARPSPPHHPSRGPHQRAIHAYRRVGFRPVGVLRRYERGPDGSWRTSPRRPTGGFSNDPAELARLHDSGAHGYLPSVAERNHPAGHSPGGSPASAARTSFAAPTATTTARPSPARPD
jgi:aminoglycoside 6'-N-acetyltransferase